jgi:hypothetical protein
VRPAATIRLLAGRGRVVTSRARIVATAARARRGGRVYTLWPDARQPMIAADMGYPPAAEWLRRTMVPTLRRLPDAAAWMSLRARAALIAETDGLAARIGTTITRARPPRIALYSPSGQPVSKAICFLFREGDREPHMVVKAMAEPRFDWRLRQEAGLVESIRGLIGEDERLAATLPEPPLLADHVDGEFVVAEPFDTLGGATGAATQEQALEWLRAFQVASSSHDRQWDADDERTAIQATSDAWRSAGLHTEDLVARRVRSLLEQARGTIVPRCAVHGDFWRGNVAARAGAIRVYDWEWAVLDGTPVVDLWSYELAELRLLAREGETSLDDPLAAALRRVEEELRRRHLDDRLALATLAPVLGGLSFRIRNVLRMPDEMERHSISLMAAVERLLASA